MKWLKKIIVLCFFITASAIISSGHVFAAENSTGNWRSIYDNILLWVNFAIIVFIIIKFGKDPLMNFLRGKKEELANQIKKFEKEKNSINAKLEESKNKIKESKDHIKSLKEKIIKKGEKEKQSIIDEAHRQSISMIENSKQKIENLINQKKSSFRLEMIDTAFDMANEKIPSIINEQDNEKLLDTYIENAEQNR